jgi:hypothetical protein
MAKAPKQYYDEGDDCPNCGKTLKQGKKNAWIYCPGRNFNNPAAGCQFPGNVKPQSVRVDRASSIAPLNNPSTEQKAIFSAAADLIKAAAMAFLLVIARAGTGKTTVLVQCARIWAAQGISALFLCFARRDRNALEARIPDNAGKVMTSNGAGLRILSDWARGAGKGRIDCNDDGPRLILTQRLRDDGLIPPQGSEENWKIQATTYYNILTAVDAIRTVKLLRSPCVPGDADFKEVLDRFDTEYDPDELPTICHYASILFRQLANLETLKVYGVDFAGQTFLPVYHNLKPAQQYQRIAVDECQDQNPYNRAIAFAYLAQGGAMVAVGDDGQAIYEWRGADSDALGEMRQVMETHGKVSQLPLTVCRRCPKAVIALAQKLQPDIQPLPDAPDGVVRELETEDQLFAELSEKRAGYVLCRMNAPQVSLCLRLLASGVPAMLAKGKIMGQLLTMIDALSGPKNGQTPIGDLLDAAKVWLEENLARAAKKRDAESAARIVNDKYNCLVALASVEGLQTSGDLRAKIRSMFPGRDETPDPRKMVVCSTVHGAKGGEAPTIYLLSPTGKEASIFDAIWSSAKDRDNTLYVATTRCAFERDKAGNITEPGTLVFVGPVPTFAPFATMDPDELDAMQDKPAPPADWTPETPTKAAPVASSKPAKVKATYTPTDEAPPVEKKPRKPRRKPATVQPLSLFPDE